MGDPFYKGEGLGGEYLFCYFWEQLHKTVFTAYCNPPLQFFNQINPPIPKSRNNIILPPCFVDTAAVFCLKFSYLKFWEIIEFFGLAGYM